MTEPRQRRGGRSVARTFVGAHTAIVLTIAACGGAAPESARYPPRPAGCDVKLFRGKVSGLSYDDIGHADAICSSDVGVEECTKELFNQACKLGGDIVYDVPSEPDKPSPDKIRVIGRVAHTRPPRTK